MLVSKEDLEALKEGMFVSKEKTLRGYKDRCKRVLSKRRRETYYSNRLGYFQEEIRRDSCAVLLQESLRTNYLGDYHCSCSFLLINKSRSWIRIELRIKD